MKSYLPKTWVRPGLFKQKSLIHGMGVFTESAIKNGETVMIWGGEVIPQDTYEDVWQNYRNGTVVQISEKEYLAAPITDNESLDESLNHSCDPNTWLVDEVTLVARRDINPGEEITLDSATWNDDDSEEYSDDDLCTCGSPLCRKKILADDWKNPELQQRYKGHFSPYLETRIKRNYSK